MIEKARPGRSSRTATGWRNAPVVSAAAAVAALATAGVAGWQALSGLSPLAHGPIGSIGAGSAGIPPATDGTVPPVEGPAARFTGADSVSPPAGSSAVANAQVDNPPGSDDRFGLDPELFVPLDQDPTLRAAFAELLSSEDPAIRAEAEALAREWLGLAAPGR